MAVGWGLLRFLFWEALGLATVCFDGLVVFLFVLVGPQFGPFLWISSCRGRAFHIVFLKFSLWCTHSYTVRPCSGGKIDGRRLLCSI